MSGKIALLCVLCLTAGWLQGASKEQKNTATRFPEAVLTLFETVPLRQAMTPVIELENGRILSVAMGSIALDKESPPSGVKANGNPKAARLADRFGNYRVTKKYTCTDGNIQIETAEIFRRNASSLYDGAIWDRSDYLPYLRTEFKISAVKTPVKIKRVILFNNAPFPDASISGYTEGSMIVGNPIINGKPHPYFAGIEHPMAQIELSGNLAVNWTPEDFKKGFKTISLPNPKPEQTLTVSFDYEQGSHRLEITAVQLIDGTGKVVAEDRHDGFSGIAKENHTYTLLLPKTLESKMSLRAEFKMVDETQSFGKMTVRSSGEQTFVTAYVPRGCDLIPGEPQIFTSVIGTAREPDQLRRSVLNYLNNERAHPYRIFPHYNAWYHLCIDDCNLPDPEKRLTETKCLNAMADIHRALYEERGVNINSYLWDDGWDDWNSLWGYHKSFPEGFKKLAEAAKKQKSGISAWLSPWGGYGASRVQRNRYGESQGISPITLDNPLYFNAFSERCLQMIRDYDMNMFKFDGIGAGTFATGSGGSPKDLDGLIRLIRILRDAKPDLFINCTVGTWASPFWTLLADSLWRQGEDCGYEGDGNKREQWINYRDGIVYDRFASKAPLFPLNSLMIHGVIVSDRSVPSPMPRPDNPRGLTQAECTRSFANEVWCSFGSGTDLQELYLSPQLMTPEWWDIVANAIKWGKANEETLVDAHWIGGSPKKKEVYGYASWSPRKGILLIRNPKNAPQTFSGTLKKWLEIPTYRARELDGSRIIYQSHSEVQLSHFKGTEEPITINLPPMGVILMEVMFK